MSAIWRRSPAKPLAWAGFGVSLAGVALITVLRSPGATAGGGASTIGDALVLVSVLLSAGLVVTQPLLLRGQDPIAVTAAQFVGAALGVLPAALLSGGFPLAPDGGAGAAVLATVALAVAGTLGPFTLFAYGQKRVSPEIARAFVNIEPVVGAAAGSCCSATRPAQARSLAVCTSSRASR